MKMTNRFLKAKHWQLFLLVFGIPLVAQLTLMGSLIFYWGAGPDFMMNYVQFYPILMVLTMSVYFGWLWSVGIGLQRLIPNDIVMKVNRFKVFLLFLVVYMIFFVAFFITSVSSGVPEPGDFIVIMPFHLLSVFCFFYAIYFAAKTLKTAEKQEKVSFSDFAGECFLMWFYPLGVWLLQPRIHRLVKEHTARPETEGSGEGE